MTKNLESLTTEELLRLKQEYEDKISQFDAVQMAFKILLNSCYGAIGNEHFRFYCEHEATAITISGQAAVKWAEKYFNQYMNTLFKTNDVDYTIYIDTDSCYLNLEPLVEKYCKNKTEDETIEFLAKALDIKFQEVVDNACVELTDLTNAKENLLDMKRESIGSAVFLKKKKYLMRIFDSEGVRFSKPEITVKGLEAVRTTTPEFCRDKIKETFEYIFTKDESYVLDFLEKTKKDFFNLPIEDIGMPIGVKNLAKYHTDGSFLTGTPYHVKAAMAYNRMIKDKNLENDYATIKEGEKVKVLHLKDQNPLQENNCFAFPDNFPKETGLEKFIDKEKQFDKTYLEPMKRVLETIGWKTEDTVSLDDFFG